MEPDYYEIARGSGEYNIPPKILETCMRKDSILRKITPEEADLLRRLHMQIGIDKQLYANECPNVLSDNAL